MQKGLGLRSRNPHLSKRPSDLRQNGTQEKTPFSSTVFHALSHGVIRFVASVSSKNHLLTGWNSLTANQGASIQWFLKLTLATKRSTPCERVWKTVPENGVFSCVQFCLRSLGRLAKCNLSSMPMTLNKISRLFKAFVWARQLEMLPIAYVCLFKPSRESILARIFSIPFTPSVISDPNTMKAWAPVYLYNL